MSRQRHITVKAPPTTSRTRNGYRPSIVVQGEPNTITQLCVLVETLAPTVLIQTSQQGQAVVMSSRCCDNANQAKKIQRDLKKQIYTLFNHTC